jgi:hypothetical protein
MEFAIDARFQFLGKGPYIEEPYRDKLPRETHFQPKRNFSESELQFIVEKCLKCLGHFKPEGIPGWYEQR